MSEREPWLGSGDPERLVAVTLPYNVARRVLDAIVYSGHRIAQRRPDDLNGLKALSLASARFGDVLQAPYHRRFNYEKREIARWAVLAGNGREYNRWLAEVYNPMSSEVKTRTYPGGPVFIDSMEDVEAHEVFNGASSWGTAYRRSDFQELYAAVKWRTL